MTDKINAEERNELIQKICGFTGLSEDAVSLLARWNEYDALAYKKDFFNELIMRTPDHVYDKYKALLEARKNTSGEEASSGADEEAAASGIAENLERMLADHKEVSLAECHNYALAKNIMPCSRERLKRIKEELRKER